MQYGIKKIRHNVAMRGECKMGVQIFVNFNGNCREAVNFYATVFDAEIPQFITFDETQVPDGQQILDASERLIMYTELMVEGDNLRFCDASSGNKFIIGNNISLTIISEDVEKTTTYFNRMKENGTVEMDLQETYWSKCFGSVKDKYDVIWQFDTQENKTVE